MNTTERCFNSDISMMAWQERNCLQCKKAVWYNQRLHRMPQYRCAIQKQIEAQASGELEINERTYKATRNDICPMLKGEEKEQASTSVLDFSKGESMVENAMPQDKEAEASTPEEPKCPPIVPRVEEQPKEKTSSCTNHDAALLKLSMETGMDFDALKEAERKMQEAITSGKMVSPLLQEAKFKKEVKSDVEKMLQTFTWKENMMIAFVPLVISHLAWIYTEKVLHYCADHRISETIKLGRAVKHIRDEYNNMLRKDLDAKHIGRIYEQTEQFHEHYANDFVILWFCVDAAYLKQYPEVAYREMRVDAFIAMLLCRFLVAHNKRMDKIIEAKMGFSQSIKDPNIDKLETCLDAYCGDYVIESTPNIDACMRILEKNINEIDFEIDDNEPK